MIKDQVLELALTACLEVEKESSTASDRNSGLLAALCVLVMAGEACMDVGSPTSWNLAIEFTAWEFIAPIYCLDIEEIKTTIQCRLWIPFDGREYLSRGEASLDVETIGAAS